MSVLTRIVLAFVLAVAAYQSSCAWTGYYGSIADKRYNSIMDSGSWRGEASQYNNAMLGIRIEWGLGFLVIWGASSALFAGGHNLLRRKGY